ncbi:2529_t:CDS:2 [Ambispora leptoticha]|uniref:2529_t:CDS:1 n=1 Tax=Ambispora leptoticha TaxID=144679 RepID=A0A9N9FJ60_9GLOM|nr:2529_t:CDS:2 [Ambispora leptoticha]
MDLISNINEQQEHPLGPNHDSIKAASQPILDLYRRLNSSSQKDENQAVILKALRYFLGDEANSVSNAQ